MAKKPVKATETETETKAIVIIPVPKRALSLEVGPAVIKTLSNVTERQEAIDAERQGLQDKRYESQMKLTASLKKLAENDEDFDLTAYFGGDSKRISTMNDRAGLGLGFRELQTVGSGDKAKQKIVYAKEVLAYFPSKTDAEDVKQRKRTFASNFLHMLKKCAQAAHGAIENDIEIKEDKKSGTLLISGPAVKKEFGQEKVLLNEKQKVEGAKGAMVTLKAKPSFTKLAEMGARVEGTVLTKRKDSRNNQTPADAFAILKETVKTLVDSINAIEQPNDKQIKELERALDAIAKKLDLKVNITQGTVAKAA